jgi:hypothetical protein
MNKIVIAILAALLTIGGAFAMPGGHHNNQGGDWLNPNEHHNQYRYNQYTGYMSYNGVGFNYYMAGTTMHIQGFVPRTLAHQEAHIAFDMNKRVTHVIFDEMGVGYARNEHMKDGKNFPRGGGFSYSSTVYMSG